MASPCQRPTCHCSAPSGWLCRSGAECLIDYGCAIAPAEPDVDDVLPFRQRHVLHIELVILDSRLWRAKDLNYLRFGHPFFDLLILAGKRRRLRRRRETQLRESEPQVVACADQHEASQQKKAPKDDESPKSLQCPILPRRGCQSASQASEEKKAVTRPSAELASRIMLGGANKSSRHKRRHRQSGVSAARRHPISPATPPPSHCRRQRAGAGRSSIACGCPTNRRPRAGRILGPQSLRATAHHRSP